MSLTVDPLAKYRKKKEDEPSSESSSEPLQTEKSSDAKENDPLSKYRKTPAAKESRKNDFLINELRKAGIEPTLQQLVEAEQRYNEGEFSRGVISGATLGASELIPGLKTEGTGFATAGDITGTLALPLNTALKGAKYAFSPLTKLAKNSPKAKKALDSFSRLAGIGAVGAASGAIHEATEGDELQVPSVENALEHGALWASLDAGLQSLGWSWRFAKALLSKSKATGKSRVSLLNDTIKIAEQGSDTEEKVAKKATELLEAPGDLEANKIAKEKYQKEVEEKTEAFKKRKVEPQVFDKIDKAPSQPYFPQEFQFEPVIEKSINEELDNSIDSFSSRAPSERQLGESIQEDIERQIEKRKKETDALYEEAAEGQEFKQVNTQKTANAIVEQLELLQSGGLKLTPEGYAKAEKQLLQLLEDIGYHVNKDEVSLVSNAIKVKDVSLKDAIEIKRRLNNIIDYDLKETSAQMFLKGPAFEIRESIRKGYGPKKSTQRKAYEKAEKLFGENAEKQGNKSIVSTRYSQKPEQIAKLIKTPSGLHDLKQNVSPEHFKVIERELLEYIRGLPEQKAQSFYREIRGQMSPDARVLAEQLIESKAPISSPSRKALQRQKLQDIVLDDLSQSSITGQRPEKALKLWKTKEGQQLIKHSLENNPNKKEILDYLSKSSFNDFFSSIVDKEGNINFSKLEGFLKDPPTLSNLRMVGGEEAVNFLKNLETISSRAKKNFSIIEGVIDKGSESERAEIDKALRARFEEKVSRHKEAQEKSEKSKLLYKLDELLDSYKIKGKALLSLFGIVAFGTKETIAIGVAYEIFKKLRSSPKLRQAIQQAAGPKANPVKLLKAYEAMDQELSD